MKEYQVSLGSLMGLRSRHSHLRIPGLAQGMLPPVGEESKLCESSSGSDPNSLVILPLLCPQQT